MSFDRLSNEAKLLFVIWMSSFREPYGVFKVRADWSQIIGVDSLDGLAWTKCYQELRDWWYGV